MKKKIVKFLIEFVGDLSFVITLIIGSIFFAAVMIGIGLGMYQLAAWLVSLF